MKTDEKEEGMEKGSFRQWREMYRRGLASLYEEAEADSLYYWVLEELFSMSRVEAVAALSREPDPEGAGRLAAVLARLQTGEPVQYIFGRSYFAGLALEVGPGVLIPRPETEELYQWACETMDEFAGTGSGPTKGKGLRILDFCTGSGALAVALALAFPGAEVFACDISPEALAVAHRNARKHGTDVRFFRQDVLREDLPENVASAPFHLMLANPPYVLPSEKARMRSNVLDYEPPLALFVDRASPLQFYEAIARLAASHLEKGGFLLEEINEALPEENCRLLSEAGFRDVEVRRDIRGKFRMLRGRRAGTPS